MVVEPTLEMLTKAQRASLNLAADTFAAAVRTAKTGVTQPDELLTQMASFVSAVGDVIGNAGAPLQSFIHRQQELADSMATLAELHSQLADVMATVAQHHKAAVDALEAVSAPVLALAVKNPPEPAPPKKRAPRKK